MDRAAVRQCLESAEHGARLLRAWRLRDLERGRRNLAALSAAVGEERLGRLLPALSRALPSGPDPDMALNNLERFLAEPAGAAQLPGLLESAGRGLATLLRLLGTSQWASDLLARHPEFTAMLRVPLRRSPAVEELCEQLRGEVAAAFEDSAVLRAFRQFRQRHLLRVGTNDVIRERPLEEVTRDVSRVAEASIEVALETALRQVGARFGMPFAAAGAPARCVVLAFGKLGGEELNYSSDIDLMVVYDEDGVTRGPRGAGESNEEFFGRVTGALVRLLSAHTDEGQAYRVDLRLRPEGHRGPLARSLASTLRYYDVMGRTWERQALIKARPVAGDRALGDEFLRAVEPFVYRKYLGSAEIKEIRLLKRKVEHAADRAGGAEADVKTGPGGIRDVEFAVQFLQLLNGGDLPAVRERNTVAALMALERAGCLTDQEYHILDDAYRFLRKVEHRLQFLFDLQTHRLPERPEELGKLALRMGYKERGQGSEARGQGKEARGQGSEVRKASKGRELPEATVVHVPHADGALDAFLKDYREKTRLDRQILDHLLHQAFAGGEAAEPEADLVLDPSPDPKLVTSVLGGYGFRDTRAAYQNLTHLAQESVPFLSTRRCRHFLAGIAATLLRALAETSDPDMALVNLEKVSASLGAKSVLWELFSFNPPSLKLYVDLCASSQFLCDILINNPGMIDELLDSLVLNQPRTADELGAELAQLCRGAEDPEPILHGFKDKELLRIGVRDILGKDSVRQTTAALSDLAETILVHIVGQERRALFGRVGEPVLAEGPRAGNSVRFALLALGKLGGREMSYHSDLDLMLVYEGDGRTPGAGGASLNAFEYYTELARRVIKVAGAVGPMGRLYPVDMRLRPTGKSGSLVLPLEEFRRYHAGGGAQLWERQALTRARVVTGDADFGTRVAEAVAEAAFGEAWRPEWAEEIRAMRGRVEAGGGGRDLKRGFGGIVDVEFLVQLYQLKYGGDDPNLRRPNTWDALEALRGRRLLSEADFLALWDGYNFLRLVESRLRIVHNVSRDELPARPEDLERLARRLGFSAGGASQAFLAELERHTVKVRDVFVRLVEHEKRSEARGQRPERSERGASAP